MSKKRILIIGGVAGGASAATRIRRLSEEAEIVIFEKGEYISFANCGLPYYIGGEIKNREQLLLQTPAKIKERYNIDARINSEVIKIDRTHKQILILDKKNNQQYSEQYDVLILSPGAKPIVPPLPGIETTGIFTLRNIADMDAINNWISTKAAKNAVVIGGGYIGLEMAEALRNKQLQVSLVEMANQVMNPIDPEMAAFLHQELSSQNIDLHLNEAVISFSKQDKQINVQLKSGATLNTDMVILAIGVKPEISLARDAEISIGNLGGISVNENLQTSDPYIYAIGDVIEVQDYILGIPTLIPLAGPANRQGRIVADNIFGRNNKYTGTQGTGVCKVFNLTVGMTGLNEKTLQRQKINYEKIYVHGQDHANYYPGATNISLKLLFDRENGRILGAQAIGKKGVDKRIDVIATAIRAKLNVSDLTQEELSYAPPYGSAKDIVNHAGFIAENVLNNDVKICHSTDILQIQPHQLLVDVRTEDEFLCGSIPNAINLPLDELRSRLHELPKDKELILFCKVGLRGYLAYRILVQHGFNCKNLSGGYTTYAAQTATLPTTNTSKCSGVKVKTETKTNLAKNIDASCLQCPGPIQQLKIAIDAMQDGESLSILTTDAGFLADAPAWCQATGNTLLSVTTTDAGVRSVIQKGKTEQKNSMPTTSTTQTKKLTIVVFSGDLDKAIAAFIIANGAVAMGFEVTLFFTFWGLNILKKKADTKLNKTFIEHMFGFMLPRNAKKLALSKMNMFGLGSIMIKDIMRRKNVASLPELIASAQASKVELIACNMSMDVMGIKDQELIDGVAKGGVATYLAKASEGAINLFI
jgi:CoA-disulfide reductase